MTTRKITDAAIEPITLDQAKAHLRVVDGADDALIAQMITDARQDCEARLQRTLIDSTWRRTLDAFPHAIRLRMGRVLAVEQVRYIDAQGAAQVLDPSCYLPDTESVPGYVVPAYGFGWPAARAQINAVQVDYRAGFGGTTPDEQRAAVPAPIKRWILLRVGSLYEHREDYLVGGAVATLPFVDGMLDAWRVIEYA